MLGAELKKGGGGVGGEARGREESLEARSLKHRRPKLSLRVLSFLIRVASYYVILKKAVEVKDLYGNSVKGAVSHALRMLHSLKSVQPNKKSN